MISGSLALLETTVEDLLEPYGSGGFATLDVQDTQTYLDDARVQHGRACSTVEGETEEIHVSGTSIGVEQVHTVNRVWTPWVADVTGAGFVVAERTATGEPPFPFDLMWARTGVPVEPARLDCGAFIRRQRDHDRDFNVWFTGRKLEERETGASDVEMNYGQTALKKDAIQAEVGVGFETPWHGTVVSGIIYASGYVAIHSPSGWGPMQFARFVSEDLLPVAYVPDEDDTSEQTELGDSGVAADGGDA